MTGRTGSKNIVNSVDYPVPGIHSLGEKAEGRVECQPGNFTWNSSDKEVDIFDIYIYC